MQPSDKTQSELFDEELVAYLDGQLDAESARRIEQRLAGEEPVRRRLQELAQSWDMLDQLSRAVADETFTRTTVEMVALAAERDMAEQQAAEPRHRQRRWLWGGAAGCLAASLGFFLAAKIWTDPNDKLLRDLPVIENLAAYQQIGKTANSIDFLHMLNDKELFTDETADSAGTKTPANSIEPDEGRGAKDAGDVPVVPTSIGERRELVEKMTAQQQEELRAKFDRFSALSADEQERLRHLDNQLTHDPQSERLRRIMLRFHEWLSTLLTTERAELLGSDSTDRIALIRKLRHEQEARLAAQIGDSKLLPKDVDAIHLWLDTFAKSHETDLLKASPRQAEINALESDKRHRQIVGIAWYHWRNGSVGPGKAVDVSGKELQDLINQLSPIARGILESQPKTQQRIQTISGWLAALPPRTWILRQGGDGRALNAEDLNVFLQTLPEDERHRLAALPGDERNRELRQKYNREHGGRGSGQHDPLGSHDRGRGGQRPDTAPDKSEKTPSKADAQEVKPDRRATPSGASIYSPANPKGA